MARALVRANSGWLHGSLLPVAVAHIAGTQATTLLVVCSGQAGAVYRVTACVRYAMDVLFSVTVWNDMWDSVPFVIVGRHRVCLTVLVTLAVVGL